MTNLCAWAPVTNALLGPLELEQLSQYKKLWVGFSGGLDSTVLLHILASYNFNIEAIHINHSLSPNAAFWQAHCANFCQNLNLAFRTEKVEFSNNANIEARAREARFAVFTKLIEQGEALILGHHQDDQAETVLLQLLRGTGIDGLAAIEELKIFAKGHLQRPLLNKTRQELENYAQEFNLKWIEDESNENSSFARNFLRREVIPLLKTRWPALSQTLNRTTKHARDARKNLEDLALLDCPQLNDMPSILPLKSFYPLNYPRKLNLLRMWFKLNHYLLPSTKILSGIISEMVEAAADSQPEIRFKNYSLRRYQDKLYFVPRLSLNKKSIFVWSDLTKPLKIEGLGFLSAEKVNKGIKIPVSAKIEIRFRQGGEKIKWKGQTKEVKKLLQTLAIHPWHRDKIPFLYINDELAALIGYVISDLFFTETGKAYQFKLEFSER
ncbi:MAG: tRNA lysidine(34) synthetase TilS [Proteobacteria bacterium]|nr:tRNA lysidine(34) synthetase TilS [Pseudomonadota bacterium]